MCVTYLNFFGKKDLKLKFYELMIKLDQHESSYFAVCKHFKQIYDTPRIKNNPDLMKEALKNIVIYLLLAPHDNEQQNLIHILYEDKNLQTLPKYQLAILLSIIMISIILDIFLMLLK